MISTIVAMLRGMLTPPAMFAMNNVQIVALILAIVMVVIIIARRRSKRLARS